ncbi:MAG: L-serine ammonia-lyase, iron-sulfur-dependent, subunit alpha [Firmicutes bacterium]|nr:L-serine ammonia-lyase, iron-sulfur-dependent, subunit alpha [Bacillota bacterium]
MDFVNGKELIKICEKEGCPISVTMLTRERTETLETKEDILARLKVSLDIMRNSATASIENPTKSIGGLIGGEAKKVMDSKIKLFGPLLTKAIAYSQSVLEVNATMGLIVAAPTAGSSGVVPGVLIALAEEYDLGDEELLSGLLNTSAIGYLLMRNASVAGAEGGCQAEVGSASAMAASAIVELLGGTPVDCLNAAAFAISNILGMVCDPIAGLVESPCQNRNAIGVTNAFTAAQLALAGITHPVPFDEMVDAMLKVGRQLPRELRETALGGCACTPTGCDLSCKIFGQ